MTRKITLGSTKVSVSKNEAKEAQRIALMIVPSRPVNADAQWAFTSWYESSPTPEAKERRGLAGKALGLKL